MLVDLHSDLFTCGKSEKQIKRNVIQAKKQGARVIYAVYNDEKKDLDFLRKTACSIKKTVGTRCSLENACYLGEGADNGLIGALFDLIYQINPLCASLCWNNENAFAYGCSLDGGIKRLGKSFVRFLNENNIPLDLAHISEQGFYEGVYLSDKPLCTHSALWSVFPHRRNLKKEQIKLLLEKGGIFGLIGVNHFLCEKTENARAAFLRHIDEYLQNFGVKGLCLGTDFFGSDAPLFKGGDYSSYLDFADELKGLGLSDFEVERVFYRNAIGFFKPAYV